MINSAKGVRPCSHAKCRFVVHPPRERPRPWSAGSTLTPPGGSTCRSPFYAHQRRAGAARAIVKSTLTSQTISPAASAQICNADRIASHTPPRCQDRNNPYTDCHGPYRSGTSRHGAPTLVRQRIPSMSCRFIHFGGRPALRPIGSSGSIAAHCSSVSPHAPMHYAGHEGSGIRFVLVNKPSTGDLAHLLAATRENQTPTSDYAPAVLTSISS